MNIGWFECLWPQPLSNNITASTFYFKYNTVLNLQSSPLLNSKISVYRIQLHYSKKGYQFFLFSFIQFDLKIRPILQNSWKHPPFAAEIEDNVIYARGVQDMKSVGIQYIEAVRRLKETGVKLKRTVHLSFVPGKRRAMTFLSCSLVSLLCTQ